jgi:hypothetical protein
MAWRDRTLEQGRLAVKVREPKVRLVEDSELFRRVLSETISARFPGLTVIEAEDTTEGY